MRHHPHSNDVAKVAEMYERLKSVYGDALIDMCSTWIMRKDGVYYASATGYVALDLAEKDGNEIIWRKDAFFDDGTEEAYASDADADVGLALHPKLGAEAIAAMLGFKGNGKNAIASCKAYYGKETKIWGSNTGASLFDAPRAYDHIIDPDERLDPDRIQNLSDIARQWREVERRTRERETSMQNSPSSTPPSRYETRRYCSSTLHRL